MLKCLKPRTFRDFGHAEDGLAAVEFAFVLPVMITMLFGMGELSLAVYCRTDIGQVASTVADLVAQESVIGSTDLNNVYYAGNTILYPYYKAAAVPAIRITSVIFDTTTNSTTIGKVGWSCTQAGNTGANFASGPASGKRTGTVTFDQPILSSGGSVVMTEVAYKYTSPTLKVLTGAIPMTDQFYTKPRRVGQIPAPSC